MRVNIHHLRLLNYILHWLLNKLRISLRISPLLHNLWLYSKRLLILLKQNWLLITIIFRLPLYNLRSVDILCLRVLNKFSLWILQRFRLILQRFRLILNKLRLRIRHSLILRILNKLILHPFRLRIKNSFWLLILNHFRLSKLSFLLHKRRLLRHCHFFTSILYKLILRIILTYFFLNFHIFFHLGFF